MPRRKKAPSSTLTKLVQQRLQSSSPAHHSSLIKKRVSARRVEPDPDISDYDNDNHDDSDVGAIHFEANVVDLSSESSDSRNGQDQDVNESPRRPTNSQFKRKALASSDDSEPEVKVNSNNKGKGRVRTQIKSESEDEPVIVKKRRLVRKPFSDEDEDLMDEVDEDHILSSRLRKRGKKTAFQENLEKLKRKKHGQAISQSSSSSGEISISDDRDVGTESVIPFDGAKPDDEDDESHSRDETVEDSFIVEDDGTAVVDLPMAFSMNTHQDLAHHFKIICQLFVHLSVQPVRKRKKFMKQAASPEHKYFYTALSAVRRKLSGLRDSLVASSTWRSEFKKTLERYPKFERVRLEMSLPVCDACHMGGRVSTLIGRVSGQPYDRDTFQPLDDSDGSESESESEDEKLVKEFYLGRFCARRTEVFHRFSHWEYVLYEALSCEVESLRGDSGFVRVAFAGGIEPPNELDNADMIVEWLDKRQIIDMQWQCLKQMMEDARNLEAASAIGEGAEG